MAKIRTVEKEITILAETRGHALFLWHKGKPPLSETRTCCIECGEEFTVTGQRSCRIEGPANQPCSSRGGR
jgi:hypothetical protein